MTRRVTNQLIDMMEQGILDPKTVALRCLDYMSEGDVADMAESEGLIDDDNEEEQ